MWLSHSSIRVVSVILMTSFWSSEAMPEGDCGSTGGAVDIAGIISANEKNAGSQERARCVPFNKCCDDTNEPSFLEIIDERTGNAIIDISSKSNQKCAGLNLCCKCVTPIPPPGIPPPVIPPPGIPPPGIPPPEIPRGCGRRNELGVRIVVEGFKDGQTQQGEFPWMVAVLKSDTTYVGGGSLVKPRVVLTAGHKVYEETAGNLVVRIGDWDISQAIESMPAQEIGVEKILFHPQYDRTYHEYSVAILILKTEAKYGETVAPVCLPDPGQNYDGKNCFVTGWGKDNTGGDYQTILKKVSVPIIEHSKCQESLRNIRLGHSYVLPSSVICAGGGREDACEGDGGSPLVCPSMTDSGVLVQVGTVAWGLGCGVEGNPGVYGSVPASMNWITETIQKETGNDRG